MIKKFFSKQFFFVLALFLSPEVFAAGLFEVLPTDKSLEYLGMIFGGHVGVVTLSGDANPMLSRMFERFNFIIVTVGVSILSYIGIAAAINTAREGEAMGKQFSLWVPLRAMLGMLLMVPSPGTGYSVVQMTVIWVVLNGIGAANVIWGVVLDQLASGFKATGKIDIPIRDDNIKPLMKDVLRAATCMQVLNNIPNLKLTQEYGRVKVITTTDQNVTVVKDGRGQPSELIRNAYVDVGVEGSPNRNDRQLCGRFVVSTKIIKGDRKNAFNVSSLDARLAIKVNALLASFSVFEPAAAELALVKPPGSPAEVPEPPLPQSGYVAQAINGYKAQIANIGAGVNLPKGASPEEIGRGMASAIGGVGGSIVGGMATGAAHVVQAWEQDNNSVPITSDQVKAFKRLGWIFAGSYYYSMSKSSATIDQEALTMPTSGPPFLALASVSEKLNNQAIVGRTDPESSFPEWPPSLYTRLEQSVNRLAMDTAIMVRAMPFFDNDAPYTANSLPALGSGKVSSGNGFVDKVLGGISDSIRAPIIERFQAGFVSQTEDPLISMGRFGWELMLGGELSIFTAIIIAFGISMAASPVACMNPAAYAVNQLLLQLYIVIFTFLVLMWGLGATMGVYTPLIPYIIFTGTAVGWFMAVIEALVAAPLIALAMVQPSKDELGALKQPLMILANLFLRPTLMIFGFVLAASLLRAVLTMINFGFSRAVEESVIPTLFGIVPILGIYVGFTVAMVNEVFSLIFKLPNDVIRYMGGSSESFNPTEKITGKVKEGFEGGKGAAEGGLKSAGGGASGVMKTRADMEKKSFDERNKKLNA